MVGDELRHLEHRSLALAPEHHLQLLADPHPGATPGTQQWEHLVDAGEQQCPGVAGGATDAWNARYATLPGIEQAIVGATCSHHRLLWMHPFIDGNGRAARLHTHLALTAMGLTQGLWSPLRGMARDSDAYYARLKNADLPRRNDVDGRGPLSQEELVALSAWLLDVCSDQARFMAMTGLPERTARRVLASLADYGVLATETSRAPVRLAVPLKSLRFLFPRLWPEAEAEADVAPT